MNANVSNGRQPPNDQPENEAIEKIKSVLRRYFEVDPWTEKPNPDFDDAYTAQEAVDEIVEILR